MNSEEEQLNQTTVRFSKEIGSYLLEKKRKTGLSIQAIVISAILMYKEYDENKQK